MTGGLRVTLVHRVVSPLAEKGNSELTLSLSSPWSLVIARCTDGQLEHFRGQVSAAG